MWLQAEVASDTGQALGTESVPPLSPEAVQALRGIHDIFVPEAVPWTPQTAGWYVLLAVLLAVGAWTALARHRRRVANRYRREALEELVAIEGGIGTRDSRAAALAEVPPLIKRVALAVVSRADAASLTGDVWLAFLDGSYGGDGFTSGPGRLIPELTYQPAERLESVSQQQAEELIELVRVWIQSHELTATDAA